MLASMRMQASAAGRTNGRRLALRYSVPLALVALAMAASGGQPAFAATPSAGFKIDSFATPTDFSASQNTRCTSAGVANLGENCDGYRITVTNTGSVPTGGSAITLTDKLQAGLTVQHIALLWSLIGEELDLGNFLCETETLQCHFPFPLAPDEAVTMVVYVTLEASATGTLTNTASASGGGAREVSTSTQNEVASGLAPFGASTFDLYASGLDGARDTQAADHPYELTTTISLNNGFRVNHPGGTQRPISTQDAKDIVVDLPVGFVGSTLAAPECPLAQLSAEGEGVCPADTVIGHIVTQPVSIESINSPIYNLVPERGVPAEFGYIDTLHGTHVFYVHVVPSANGYLLQTTNPDIPAIDMNHIVVTFYGDPTVRDGTGNAQVPFFTNPSDCTGGPTVAMMHMDSWENPGRFNPDGSPDFNDPKWVSAVSQAPPVTGCNALRFNPELKTQPTTHEADKPSGLDFEVKLAQSEQAGVLATPTLKKLVTVLPEGLTIDPSAGDGLGACSEAQIGWVGPGPLSFTPAQPACPEASKIGSLELETPLTPRELEGEMFLARQGENPFGATLAAYVVVHDPVTGVLIKIAGRFLPDAHTGRLTAVFDENPNLPFSDLKLHFFGGPRAELATPEACGTFTVTSELTPWSAPDSGPAPTPFDQFLIDEACPGGFSPVFTAGSMNLQAGAYTPFVVSFGRSDTDQELAGLSVSLPPGLLANLNGVPLCTDAQVQQAREGVGGCPAASQVGSVLSGAGPGPDPFFVEGKAYLTGPYNGGPYGLAVIVPAIAGPFDFGTIVVRQSIRIDPTDAHVIVASDPFPTIIDGIPLRLRRVDVRIDRPGFTINPTNCTKLAFNGQITGTPLGAPTSLAGSVGYATQPGSSATFSTPFQVTNCATLGFKPKFNVTTNGKTSRANGASLNVKLSYPKAAFGSQANIRSVKVDLPKQLPSRLTTLQKACPDTTFDSNPATCPAASRVGTATASTPILSSSLTGPAYFVSHGGQKFPELIIVLAGINGITVDLHGETFINKAGITSSTFRTIPDVPIGSFELKLPQGSNSALAANGNLCASSLKMPTAFTAQNGMTIHQTTPITTTGCPKHRPTSRNGKHKKKRKRK